MAEESNNLIASNETPEKPSAEERRKDLKRFEGTKSVTKKGDGPVVTWLRTMFFSGKTVKEILLDVAENNVVPWLQDGTYNMATSFLSQFIYREHKSAPGGGSVSSTSGNFVNYVTYSDKKKQQDRSAEASQKNDTEVIQQGFEYPAFENDPMGMPNRRTALQKAKEFLDEMHRYVRKYHAMSVEDLLWMCGKDANYTWEKYGWTEEEIMAIREPSHINNPKTPYIIMMPRAHIDYNKMLDK